MGAVQFLNKKSLDGEDSSKITIKDKTIIEASRSLFGGIIGNISLKKVVATVCLNVIQNDPKMDKAFLRYDLGFIWRRVKHDQIQEVIKYFKHISTR
jgi:hypothetical protein